MNNKTEKKLQPMEILDKLRKAIEPLGYEVVGFEVPMNDYITLKIAEPTPD